MQAMIFGGKQPIGHIKVSGAKNSATRLLSAALLSDEKVEISNFPTRLIDVGHKIQFCETLGVAFDTNHEQETLSISAKELSPTYLSRAQFDVPIRTTYLLAAAQLLRSGIARIPYPGGCPIGGGSAGGRGYDLHIMVWERLGCSVKERDDHIEIQTTGLKGNKISFPISTVGGTENAILCASVASGQTNIFNAYITPEVLDLIKLLRRMGASIEVYGTSHIVINGQGSALYGAHMAVMPDRIEALTWLVYGILSKGTLTIEGVPFDSMESPLLHIRHAGIDFFQNSTSIHISPACLTSGSVQPFELACGTHPGVISDMQAFYVLLALAGAGTSRIYDYRYPERIAFVRELAKLVTPGALQAERGKITVTGAVGFRSGTANSTDLRGSMAAVIAALCAEGTSTVTNVQMALRGYNDLVGKIRHLGMDIEIITD